MIVLAVAGTGTLLGFVWQRHRRTNISEADSDDEAGNIVLCTARRAFLTSLILVRSSLFKAFKRTALHYAPVPLTFSSAVLSSFPAIFGTTFSINFVVLNGVSLAGRLARPEPSDASEYRRDRAATLTHLLCSSGGLVSFVFFQRRWEKSPLRGSLTVFGKDPRLDRCASAERYLAEKLVLLATAGYKRIASLRQLTQAASQSNGVAEAVPPLANYANRVVWAGQLVSDVNEVFEEYSERYLKTHADMQALSNKLRYPEAVKHLEPAMSKASDTLMAPLRSRQAAEDISAKLGELKRELGDQLNLGVLVAFLNLAGGAFLGMELAQLPLLRNL